MKEYKIRADSDQIRWNHKECLSKFGKCDDQSLCLWIADSDLPLDDEITQYITKRASYPYYSYNIKDDRMIESLIDYHKRIRNIDVVEDDFIFTPGTVFSFATVLQTLTFENDTVLLNVPIYKPLIHSVRIWKRREIIVPLKLENSRYFLDFETIEKEIIENKVKVFVLCSPLNPSGRVSTKDELRKIVELCKKYDVSIISDEIHWDIVLFDNKFTSMFEFINDYSKIYVLSSLNKTFNISGINSGWILLKDQVIKQRILNVLDLYHLESKLNIFAQAAIKGCCKKGDNFYKNSLKLYEKNSTYIKEFLEKNIPQLHILNHESTFLVYICFSKLKISESEMKNLLWNEAKVLVQMGEDFEDNKPLKFRINLSTEHEIIVEACDRIYEVLKNKNII